jgi:SulP family sulfate permease
VLLLVLVLLMPLASFIPMPIIAAILFIVAYNMSEWREFLAIIKTKKWQDILVLVLTFALTVIFDLVKAIAVGLVVHYAIVGIRAWIAKRNAQKEETKTE